MQGPSGARQRLTGDGGDPGTPNTRQLVDEAADMLSTLLASPDKVTSLTAAQMYSWTLLVHTSKDCAASCQMEQHAC